MRLAPIAGNKFERVPARDRASLLEAGDSGAQIFAAITQLQLQLVELRVAEGLPPLAARAVSAEAAGIQSPASLNVSTFSDFGVSYFGASEQALSTPAPR